MTVETTVTMRMGSEIGPAVTALEPLGVDAILLYCVTGPNEMRRRSPARKAPSFGAQFISGLIMPAMTFIGNLVYVGIAVVGGLQVASGAMQLGDVQAFIQYSRHFTMPLAQLGSMANLLQSGVASAERVYSLLDEEEESADPPGSGPASGRGRLVFEDASFSYSPDKPLISSLSLVA